MHHARTRAAAGRDVGRPFLATTGIHGRDLAVRRALGHASQSVGVAREVRQQLGSTPPREQARLRDLRVGQLLGRAQESPCALPHELDVGVRSHHGPVVQHVLRCESMGDRLYFRQLLAGRDFARADRVAQQMVNFAYLVGDRETGEAVMIDPAYGVDELVEILGADGMRLTGVLVTHYHPDHVGGEMMGLRIEGIAHLLARADVSAKVHVQAPEAFGVKRVTGCSDSDLELHESGDVVARGRDPDHASSTRPVTRPDPSASSSTGCSSPATRSSSTAAAAPICPGGDPEALYESLTQKLATVPDDTVLYPGHLYSPEPSLPLGEVRHRNMVFRPALASSG